MLERLSEPARQAMLQAEEESRRLGHRHLGTEHLLLGILAARDSAAARVLARESVTLAACREKVAEAVAAEQPGFGSDGLVLTARAKRSLERAGRLSLRHQSATVGTVVIMLSVLDVEGTAGQVLRGCGIDVGALRTALGNAPDDGEIPPTVVPARKAPATSGEVGGQAASAPTCPACKEELGTALAHRLVESRGDDGAVRQHVAVYCGACGATLGLSPA